MFCCGQPSWRNRWGWAGVAAVAGLAATACTTSLANPLPSTSAAPAGATSQVSSRSAATARAYDPLTGLPVTAATASRPAVAVDVAGPTPLGLSKADVVFQEITTPVRYIAVFQSRQASGVGPVTGTQPTDGQALSVLHPLLCYDGGTAIFIKELDHTRVTGLGYPRSSVFTAGAGGVVASTRGALRAVAGHGPPPPMFSYPRRGEKAAVLATTGLSHPGTVRLAIPGYGTETWQFQPRTDRWEMVSGGPRIQVANLVVQIVTYRQVVVSRRDGITVPSARLIGSGRAVVFSGSSGKASSGTAASGTWSKPHLNDVTNYFDANGFPMTFQPGTTWILLAPVGSRVSPAGGSG
jgi:hypothetical protein